MRLSEIRVMLADGSHKAARHKSFSIYIYIYTYIYIYIYLYIYIYIFIYIFKGLRRDADSELVVRAQRTLCYNLLCMPGVFV